MKNTIHFARSRVVLRLGGVQAGRRQQASCTAPPVSTTAPQQTTEKPDDKPLPELTVWHIYGEGDAMRYHDGCHQSSRGGIRHQD